MSWEGKRAWDSPQEPSMRRMGERQSTRETETHRHRSRRSGDGEVHQGAGSHWGLPSEGQL